MAWELDGLGLVLKAEKEGCAFTGWYRLEDLRDQLIAHFELLL
jgi:hypothetical protein